MKPTIVFIHGFPLSKALWEKLSSLEQSANLISFDLPGFGNERALPKEQHVSLTDYANAALSQLDSRDLSRAIFCGLSLGGYILFEIWRRAPERVAGFIFCDTRPDADNEKQKQARDKALEHVSQGNKKAVLDDFYQRLLAKASYDKPEMTTALHQMMEAASPLGLTQAITAIRNRKDSTDLLPTITAPSLVLCGEHDAVSPPDVMQAMAAKIPQHQFALISNAGHLIPLENPVETAQQIQKYLKSFFSAS